MIVVADPKPRDCITIKNADGTIATCYSYRPNIFLVVDTFEMQRWMKGIFCLQAIGFSGSEFYYFVKRCVCSPK